MFLCGSSWVVVYSHDVLLNDFMVIHVVAMTSGWVRLTLVITCQIEAAVAMAGAIIIGAKVTVLNYWQVTVLGFWHFHNYRLSVVANMSSQTFAVSWLLYCSNSHCTTSISCMSTNTKLSAAECGFRSPPFVTTGNSKLLELWSLYKKNYWLVNPYWLSVCRKKYINSFQNMHSYMMLFHIAHSFKIWSSICITHGLFISCNQAQLMQKHVNIHPCLLRTQSPRIAPTHPQEVSSYAKSLFSLVITIIAKVDSKL